MTESGWIFQWTVYAVVKVPTELTLIWLPF